MARDRALTLKSLQELRPEGQETVRAVLAEFIAHVGPDLASRFVCRLR